LRSEVNLAHAAGRQLTLQTKIAAKNPAFITRIRARDAGRRVPLRLGRRVAHVNGGHLRLNKFALSQVGERNREAVLHPPRGFRQRRAAGRPTDAQNHNEEARAGVGAARIRVKIGGNLHVFETEAARRQRRRNARQGAGMVEAHYDGLKRLRGEGSKFQRDRTIFGQEGDQAHVPGDLRWRVALEIGDGQTLTMPLHQRRSEIRAVLADGFQQIDHGQSPFPT
jgi:hypothetical protein